MPYKKVDITGEGTEVVDGGRGTPVDVVQEPTNELEKADTRFIASDKAPKKTVVDSDLQVLGKYYDKDGNEIGGGSGGSSVIAVNYDIEDLPSDVVAQVKGGETIYSISSATSHICTYADDTKKDFVYTNTNEIMTAYYLYNSENQSWYFEDSVSYTIQEGGLTNPVNEDLVISYDSDLGKSKKILFKTNRNDAEIYADSPDVHIQSMLHLISRNIEISGYAEFGNGFSTPNFSQTNINTQTPASAGTISKIDADDYVRWYLSGKLLKKGDICLAVKEYRPNAVEGENYLVLGASQHTNSIDIEECISYKVNAGGTLNITYETM